jgi:hypothetical protein
VESDPQFTSISTNDFSIKDSSPVIGAGLNVGNTYQEGLDMNSTWPLKVLLDSQGDFGGGWTIGAYVYTD